MRFTQNELSTLHEGMEMIEQAATGMFTLLSATIVVRTDEWDGIPKVATFTHDGRGWAVDLVDEPPKPVDPVMVVRGEPEPEDVRKARKARSTHGNVD